MASASERNRRALDKLIRERRQREARDLIRKKKQTLKNPTASKDQRYRARKAIERAEGQLAALTVIYQAEQWDAYRLVVRRNARSADNAREFLSGFGTPGATGHPNRYGGFNASRTQIRDRDRFVKYVNRMSLRTMDDTPLNRVYSASPEFWDIWRNEYANAYL